MGQNDQAIAVFNSAISAIEDNFELQLSKGQLLEDLGRMEDALKCYETILAKYDYAVAKTRRARVLISLGRI